MSRTFRHRCEAAFLLLETMIGVMVFALGMLALARCVERCLDTDNAKAWDERARVALENRMAEIEASAVFFETGKEEKLQGMFEGMTLNQTRTLLRLQDENKKELAGLFKIHLEAVWKEPAGPQSKELTFYVYQPR
jgi:Tfp pilus assembly protein PilV